VARNVDHPSTLDPKVPDSRQQSSPLIRRLRSQDPPGARKARQVGAAARSASIPALISNWR
jgi:hypothetical protein